MFYKICCSNLIMMKFVFFLSHWASIKNFSSGRILDTDLFRIYSDFQHEFLELSPTLVPRYKLEHNSFYSLSKVGYNIYYYCVKYRFVSIFLLTRLCIHLCLWEIQHSLFFSSVSFQISFEFKARLSNSVNFGCFLKIKLYILKNPT